MAPLNLHLLSLLLLLLLLLLSSSLSTPLPSNSNPLGDDFKRWVSWNVQNHKKTTTTSTLLSSTRHGGSTNLNASRSSGSSTPLELDPNLGKAEEAKVRYIVSQNGSGDYVSIMQAIDSIPSKNKRRVILFIQPGIYREKIVIPKSKGFITFLGSPESPPTITGNDTAATKNPDGKPMKTYHSATVAINGNYFVAANIKFENTAPYPEEGTNGGQAVALRISSDKAAFYNCCFKGTQDTLYDHKGIHYFNNCFIEGSVDFIFGYGRTLYENCKLNSIAKKVASLTAQKRTNVSIESGFSFIGSTITGSGLLYLGRAWGDKSRVVFSYSFMDKVVIPKGWEKWNVNHPEESGVYYGEYRCSGPGANWTARVEWAHQLTDEEAQPFLGTYYVYGDTWILGPPQAT